MGAAEGVSYLTVAGLAAWGVGARASGKGMPAGALHCPERCSE